MNQYTEIINYLEDYLNITKPLLNKGQLQFPDIEGKLEFCIKSLKDHTDYLDKRDNLN